MEDLAFVSIPKEDTPKDLNALHKQLIANGLNGSYSIDEDALILENEDGVYEFRLASEEDFEGSSSGVEVAGEWDDVAAILIDLQDMFEAMFPNSEFSSAYDF